MRKLFLATAALAIAGLSLPAVPAHAEDRVVIKSGDRHHRHHWDRDRHHEKVVIIKKHRHHHDHD